MSTATLELPDVVGFVLERADENDLDGIAQAMKSRRGILREKAAAAVTEQATVTIADISPKYLNGLSGVVKEIVNGRGKRHATITLDKASTSTLAFSSGKYGFLAGRDTYDLSGVPLSCCKVTRS
ncbi:hypothetical protein [Amycolatopsis sp. NPDC004378]